MRGLPQVFKPGERPWIQLEGADAERVSEVVMRCPTGALHFEAAGDLEREPVPTTNTIQVTRAGPLHVRGDLRIVTEAGDPVLEDVRVALCRCGGSRNPPFCDGSHFRLGFGDAGEVFEGGMKPGESPGRELSITIAEGGPLRLSGPMTLQSADDRVRLEGGACHLCRCGGSRNKPFCDGSHATRAVDPERTG